MSSKAPNTERNKSSNAFRATSVLKTVLAFLSNSSSCRHCNATSLRFAKAAGIPSSF